MILSFVWMLIRAIGIIVVTTGLMGALIHNLRRHADTPNVVGFAAGVSWLSVCLGIALILYGRSADILPGLFFAFLALWSVLFLRFYTHGLTRELFMCAVCLSSVLMIPADQSLFPGLYGILDYPLLGLSLYLMTGLFSVLDRVPMVSLITLMTQAVLLILLGGQGVLSQGTLMTLFYFFVVTLAVAQTTKIFTGMTVLGSYAAPMAGYVIGFVWSYMMTRGLTGAPLILFGYNVFEILLSAGTGLAAAHTLSLSSPFMIERTLARASAPDRVYRYLFFVYLMLAFLGVLCQQQGMNLMVFVFMLIIVFSTYIRLKNWDTPKPSFRNLASDIREGFSQLKQELNTLPTKTDKVASRRQTGRQRRSR